MVDFFMKKFTFCAEINTKGFLRSLITNINSKNQNLRQRNKVTDYFIEKLLFFAAISNNGVFKVSDHENEFEESKFKIGDLKLVTRVVQARTQACVRFQSAPEQLHLMSSCKRRGKEVEAPITRLHSLYILAHKTIESCAGTRQIPT